MYDRYCSVISAIGISYMFISFFFIKNSNRSRGPSNSLNLNCCFSDSPVVEICSVSITSKRVPYLEMDFRQRSPAVPDWFLTVRWSQTECWISTCPQILIARCSALPYNAQETATFALLSRCPWQCQGCYLKSPSHFHALGRFALLR